MWWTRRESVSAVLRCVAFCRGVLGVWSMDGLMFLERSWMFLSVLCFFSLILSVPSCMKKLFTLLLKTFLFSLLKTQQDSLISLWLHLVRNVLLKLNERFLFCVFRFWFLPHFSETRLVVTRLVVTFASLSDKTLMSSPVNWSRRMFHWQLQFSVSVLAGLSFSDDSASFG